MRISDWSSDVCSSDLDVYMDKLAVGPGYSPGIVNFDNSVRENVEAVAREKGCKPEKIIVCVLDRPRHEAIIAELRSIGCGVALIPDGDVAAVIATTHPQTHIHISMGSGRAPPADPTPPPLPCA